MSLCQEFVDVYKSSEIIAHSSINDMQERLDSCTLYNCLSKVTQSLTLNYFTPKLSQLNPKMYPKVHGVRGIGRLRMSSLQSKPKL